MNNNLVKESSTTNKSLTTAQKILVHKDKVQSFRILACKELQAHIASNQVNTDPERIERLLLRLSSLKKISTPIMEELFFNDVIGNVQIDSLIPSIIGLDTDAIDQIEELVEKSSEGYIEKGSSEETDS